MGLPGATRVKSLNGEQQTESELAPGDPEQAEARESHDNDQAETPDLSLFFGGVTADISQCESEERMDFENRSEHSRQFCEAQRNDILRDAWCQAKEGNFGMTVEEGVLSHRKEPQGQPITQPVCQMERRGHVLKLAHDSPRNEHLRFRNNFSRNRANFHRSGIKTDVREYCRTHHGCQTISDQRAPDRIPIEPLTRPDYPFQVVNVDIAGL